MRNQSWLPGAFVAAVAFVLLSTASCGGCNGVDCVIQASEDLAEELISQKSPQVPDIVEIAGAPTCAPFVPASTVGQGLIFIDITQSMAGFTSGAEYREFDYVMDAVSGSLGVSNIVEFGNKGGALFSELPTSSAQHDQATYVGQNNPDYCLYNFALNWQEDKPILYLTDGVLSALSGTASGPTIGALYQWLEAGHHIGTMAFRGGFAGRLWSEQAGNWIGEVDVPDRPFYLFILTRDQNQLTAVLDQLRRVLLTGQGGTLREQFAPAGVVGDSPLTIVQFGERERSCSVQSVIPNFTQNTALGWTMVAGQTADDLKNSTQELVTWECFPAALANDPSEQWFSGGDMTFTYHVWAEPTFTAAANPLEANFEVAGSTLEGTIGRGFPTTTQYSFWALEMRGRRGPLRQDLRDLSTFSDTDVTRANRTYQFDFLIENLALFDFERNPATASFYLTVDH